MARKPRGLDTVGDLTRALGIMLIVVVVLIVITPRRHTQAVKVVDYQPLLGSARVQAPYHILAPEGLPEQWRPTSVRYEAGPGGSTTWHLGFVTPRDAYATIGQSDGNTRKFIETQTNVSRSVGRLDVAGAIWERRYRQDKDQRALVRVDGKITIIVTGTASYSELAEFASALR